MKNIYLFDQNLPWYKGNLHAHTTESDGRLSPEDVISLFKAAGYDFLCLTDHRKLGLSRAEDGFLVIPGAEYDINDFDVRTAWHITGINLGRPLQFDKSATPEDIVSGIREAGALAVLAHPTWSLMSHEQIMRLPGIEAIEVYNGISEAYGARGDSSGYVDVLASKGYARPLLAVDDCHFYDKDAMRGFTMVNTDDLSPSGIVSAIRQGRSYASQGPRLDQIRVGDGFIHIDCQPLKRVSVLTDSFWVRQRVTDGTKDNPVTRVDYQIMPKDTWARVEGEDFDGKKCWSNVFRV